jgi:hypothetical protein
VSPTLREPQCSRSSGFLTVSRAIAKEEGTDAVAGAWVLQEALFWIPRATLAILRREEEEVSGPKEIE